MFEVHPDNRLSRTSWMNPSSQQHGQNVVGTRQGKARYCTHGGQEMERASSQGAAPLAALALHRANGLCFASDMTDIPHQVRVSWCSSSPVVSDFVHLQTVSIVCLFALLSARLVCQSLHSLSYLHKSSDEVSQSFPTFFRIVFPQCSTLVIS